MSEAAKVIPAHDQDLEKATKPIVVADEAAQDAKVCSGIDAGTRRVRSQSEGGKHKRQHSDAEKRSIDRGSSYERI
jgi:hypothetical protein